MTVGSPALTCARKCCWSLPNAHYRFVPFRSDSRMQTGLAEHAKKSGDLGTLKAQHLLRLPPSDSLLPALVPKHICTGVAQAPLMKLPCTPPRQSQRPSVSQDRLFGWALPGAQRYTMALSSLSYLDSTCWMRGVSSSSNQLMHELSIKQAGNL
ncbi:hypothetical protein SKAU_G00311560 [Synaphobranchus kaupii]|uniref:Uncharacterized protein n=1 Tax=Synaphobranchus kaupii TaxID=118154 RepID=A0A9Q1ILA5_SYNKA|nr:hypothetical protein SKAU_G00311560 [Synaphobranchus kaupii]